MFFTLIYTEKKKNQDHECRSDQKTKTEKKKLSDLDKYSLKTIMNA